MITTILKAKYWVLCHTMAVLQKSVHKTENQLVRTFLWNTRKWPEEEQIEFIEEFLKIWPDVANTKAYISWVAGFKGIQ